jgi:hypothetical protein
MSPQLASALTIVEQHGWYVFPLVPGGKRPALHGAGRCPRTRACADGHVGWEQRATRDPEKIRRCWATGPFNVGVATGPSGLVVIDLDTPKPGRLAPPEWQVSGVVTGEDVLSVLCEQAGEPLPFDTYTVRTPTGGRHLYYRAPGGIRLRNTSGKLGWLIDTRAHGGYVVAAGSTTARGRYTTEQDRVPASLPEWLTQALTPTPLPPQRPVTVELGTGRRAAYLHAAITRNLHAVTESPEGQRNRALYGAAVALGQLIAGNALTDQDVTPALLNAALTVGLSEAEATRTIRSGYRAGANRPRSVAA